MEQQATIPATPLGFGFCQGTAPQKWLQRWEATEQNPPLAPQQLNFAFLETADPHRQNSLHPSFLKVLEAGGVCLVRTLDGSKPTAHAPLHSVLLYTEALAVVTAKDSDLAQLSEITQEAEFELCSLLSHPWHLPAYPLAQTWADPSWMPQTIADLLELVATGMGQALLPLPLARQLSAKQHHRVLPVSCELAAPKPTVWVCWLTAVDSPQVQNLIGVLRGRKPNSSRHTASQTNSKTQKRRLKHGTKTGPKTVNTKNSRRQPQARKK